jgi:hypothetical protein
VDIFTKALARKDFEWLHKYLGLQWDIKEEYAYRIEEEC